MNSETKQVSQQRTNEFLLNKINREKEHPGILYGACCLLLVGAAIAAYMFWHFNIYGQWAMDDAWSSFMQNYRTPWLNTIFRSITAVGETIPVILVTLAAMIFFASKKRQIEAGMLGMLMLVSWQLNEFLKAQLQRPRPDFSMHLAEAHGFSLPSGHSMNVMTLVLVSLYFFWTISKNKRLKIGVTIAVLLYAVLVGISRVYLNVHYISDVITGWSIAIVMSAVTVFIHRILRHLYLLR